MATTKRKSQASRILFYDGDLCIEHDGQLYYVREHRPDNAGTHREWRNIPVQGRNLDTIYRTLLSYFGAREGKHIVKALAEALDETELLIPERPAPTVPPATPPSSGA